MKFFPEDGEVDVAQEVVDGAEGVVPNKTVAMLEEITKMMMLHKREQFDLTVENSDSPESVREMFDRFHENAKELVSAVELLASSFAKRERTWEDRLARETSEHNRLLEENLRLLQELQSLQQETGVPHQNFSNGDATGEECSTPAIQSWSTQIRSKRGSSSSSSSVLDTVSAWTSQPSEALSSAAYQLKKSIFEWPSGAAASARDPSREDVMHWSTTACAPHVAVGEQSMTASYSYAGDGEVKAVTLCGFVVSGSRLPMLSDHSSGFALHVLKCNQDWDDGMAIGVTSRPPKDWQAMLAAGGDPPKTADVVSEVWLAGFEGEYFEMPGDKPKSVEIEWKSNTLRPGDIVMVLVIPEQQRFLVFVNDTKVVDVSSKLPDVSVPLYGVVDLLGTADTVALASNEELRQRFNEVDVMQ